MALVRVYCGVATAEMAPWLTVAVVDDSGRLLDMRHISDDPAGYAYLGALLADRSGGSAPVAIDSHEHLVAQLLAAANRPIAIADEHALADFAERFSDDTSYDEMQAPPTQRRAVGPGPRAAGRRALRHGAEPLAGTWTRSSRCSPPTARSPPAGRPPRPRCGRCCASCIRRRCGPTPTRPSSSRCTILDALPEPGLLTTVAVEPQPRRRAGRRARRQRRRSTPTTAANAITALRVAVEESPAVERQPAPGPGRRRDRPAGRRGRPGVRRGIGGPGRQPGRAPGRRSHAGRPYRTSLAVRRVPVSPAVPPGPVRRPRCRPAGSPRGPAGPAPPRPGSSASAVPDPGPAPRP